MDTNSPGFEHCMPNQVEMLKHQAVILIAEIYELRAKLAEAQANITKLVEINVELNDRIIAEFRRANGAYVDYVNLMNYARCSYGIDLDRDDAEREKTRRLNEQLKDRIRPPVDGPMCKPSFYRPHSLMPESYASGRR